MIEYALRDENGNEYPLNDVTINQPVKGSLTYNSDAFSFENEIVENSALPGSVKLGKTRIKSRQISLLFTRAEGEDSDTFRTEENVLLKFLFKAIELRDNTNNLKIPIALLDYNLSYDGGAHKMASENEIVLQLLEPFWSEITATNYHIVSIPIGTALQQITNNGHLQVPPYITLNASLPVTEFQIYIEETKEGIQLTENIFGQTGFDTLTIDCINGLVLIGELDRTISILPGTGFFTIPNGTSTIVIVTNGVFSFDMNFYERFYI